MPAIRSLLALVGTIVDRLEEEGAAAVGFREPIQRGSASGFVCIEPDPDDPETLLLVVQLELLPTPERDHEAFFRHLLRLNRGFRGRAAFGVSEDGMVSLSAGRPITDLDPGEVLDLILWTSEQADLHDDLLAERFS